MGIRSELLSKYNLNGGTEGGTTKSTGAGVRNSLINKYMGDVNADYINSFLTDAQSFFDGAEGEHNGITYGNAASTYDTKNKTYEDLNARSNLIRGWLNLNKSHLNEETYNDLTKSLDTYGTSSKDLIGHFQTAKDYYAQWKTEDDYNSFLEALKKAEEDAAKWKELTGGYDHSKNQAEGKAGWDDYVATQERIAQNQAQAEAEKPFWEKLLGYMGDIGQDTSLPVHTTETAKQGYRDWASNMQKPDDRWTEEQKLNFGYLWKTNEDKAASYAYAVNNMLNIQQEQGQLQEIRKRATDSFGAGAADTIGAILSAPLGLADYLGDVIAQDTLGYIPKSDGQVTPFEYSQAVTGGISEHLNTEYGTLDEDMPIIGGKGWGDVYGLGTSIAQSALSAFSGGPAQALVTFFGSTAAAGVDDALNRGASGDQAVAYGTMLGLAEGLSEMVGVDNLLKVGSAATMRQLAGNILKQGAAEGLEEGISSVLGNFADHLVMGDKSNFNTLVKQYTDQGWSEEKAKQQAWLDMAEDVAYDMLGGFVSGGVHAAPMTTYQTIAGKFQTSTPADSQTHTGAEGTQNAVEAKPGTLEWVQEIADLGAGKETQKNAAQTSGVKYQLLGYTQHQIDNWKNSKRIVLFEGIEHFKQFIKNALSGKPQTNKKMYFGAIPTDLASVIKDATGVDVDGYNLALAENEIRKINKDHGNEETEAPRGQRAVTEADYLNIPDVVQSPDSITLSSKLYEGKPVIEFRKRNGNETSVVAAVVSDKRLDLFVQTTFVNKKTGSIATPEPVQAGSFTPKATGGTAPTASISENGENVNTKTAEATADTPKVAEVLTTEPETEKTSRGLWSWMKEKVFDKGMVFETLALKTKNRELQAKWNATRYAQRRAQWLIGNGTENVKSLNEIREEVESTGKTEQFSDYLYHKHNIDRMQLEARYQGVKNKPVLGDSVTAEVSREAAAKLEETNPEFKQLAEDVYSYMNYLRQLLVDNGVISQETANLWAEMYPHYVPIRREGKNGRSINVPLDTGRTGVNTPVKKAKGGDRDILPVFDTMAQRTLQTYTAIARNSFGVELKNTLKSTVSETVPGVDEVIDSIDTQDELLQEGKNGENPTFTVFENGERVTFEITDEMYDALKPISEGWAFTFKPANVISSFHRGLLTEYNPTFLLTNAIKDVQDVLINSQHPAKTYAKIPQAYVELAKKGKWYREYMANGGEHNTYFSSDTNTFEAEDKGLKKLLDMPPLSTISKLNSSIEMAPRLAEYMASREEGSSIDVAMLDAARVTTNFAAGGELTKLLDRNGATFLNASVQGMVQQARNIREAKMNGAKGWVSLATKFTLAGLPALLLNGLIWDDDEDYAELSDYVKDNYYIVGKYGDGQFVRIPKGRVTAVIQSAIEQIGNTVTGNDEADWQRFAELVLSNFAPNNPADNNVLSPIIQAVNNKTWYGEDLVPTRLQDLPAAEQYDESTDAFSKWLGEKLNISPVKIHYLLDQYGGGVADTVLPMLTPKAESGDDSVVGTLLAPLKDKFTVDSVMSNQNITDFYDKLDELTTNAKASSASVEDKIRYKYINSVSADLRDLYAEKRRVQSSDLPDDQKYAQVRSIQQKIADTAQKALEAFRDPYSTDKSGMVAGVIGDSIADLTDCWKSGTDAAAAITAIEQAYGAYAKMGNDGKAGVKAEGGRVADYLAARESGITTKTFADLYETYYSIDKSDGTASEKAARWSYALEKAQEQGTITAAQKNTLKEEMNFWQMIPADTDRFDELTGGGLSADKADLVTEILGLLKPETGKTTVRTIQQVEAITAADDKLTEAEQKTALKSVLSDNAYEKYLEVLKLGMSTDDYASSYRLYLDAEGSGKKARTIALYQEEFGISYSVAKTLYEIYSPSSK